MGSEVKRGIPVFDIGTFSQKLSIPMDNMLKLGDDIRSLCQLHPTFIVVINTDCKSVCYRIYTRQKFQIMPERCQAFLRGVYPNKRSSMRYLLLQ